MSVGPHSKLQTLNSKQTDIRQFQIWRTDAHTYIISKQSIHKTPESSFEREMHGGNLDDTGLAGK